MKTDNGIIAEFMGMTCHHNDNSVMIHMTSQGNEIVPIESMGYHTSWDWLMPVVEKIESLRDANGNAYRFTIDMCNAQIEETHIEILGGSHKIDTTYKAVVKFINHINKEKL
tara:strand:+ start:2217 stop:2552 length:336 start_codon:yes stop_codon:yes gene_type:complete